MPGVPGRGLVRVWFGLWACVGLLYGCGRWLVWCPFSQPHGAAWWMDGSGLLWFGPALRCIDLERAWWCVVWSVAWAGLLCGCGRWL